MIIKFDSEGTLANLKKLLHEVEADPTVQGIMVLAGEGNYFTPETTDPIFMGVKKAIFGGIFPQILYNTENLVKGTIIAGIRHNVRTFVFENISNNTESFDQIMDDASLGRPKPDSTIFMFIDGMSKNIAGLLDSTFNHMGLIANYIGGGAGSHDFHGMPCIITNSGLKQDAAVLAFADLKSGIGVAHGWQPVSEPMKITSSTYNTLASLDWKPALEVYCNVLADISKTNINEVTFGKYAKSYPLGIVKFAEELLVRDPVSCNGNSMVCLGEMPQNAFIYILKGDSVKLLAGARKTRSIAEKVYFTKHGTSINTSPLTFFIDCVTRAEFLGVDFKKELEIASAGKEMIGALTLGEIANSGSDYLEFYNKTSVIGILED